MVIWFLDSDFFPRAAKIPLNKHVLFPQFFVSHLKKTWDQLFSWMSKFDRKSQQLPHNPAVFWHQKRVSLFFWKKTHVIFSKRILEQTKVGAYPIHQITPPSMKFELFFWSVGDEGRFGMFPGVCWRLLRVIQIPQILFCPDCGGFGWCTSMALWEIWRR